ncbi:MAG: hypothetical protein ACQERC_12415, partial [Bacteroidota bacterium]
YGAFFVDTHASHRESTEKHPILDWLVFHKPPRDADRVVWNIFTQCLPGEASSSCNLLIL